MDEAKQDLASRYVLGELSPDQESSFEAELSRDAELVEEVRLTREALALLALAAPPVEPPPYRAPVESRATPAPAPRRRPWPVVLPWALAALLALVCGWQATERGRLGTELATLQSRNALAELRISSLQSQVQEYAKTSAVVVWSQGQQNGVVKLQNAPLLPPDKTYELWVLDSAHPAPVSAGLVRTPESGLTQAAFRPADRVGTELKFAISVENAGGSTSPKGPQGPIVFVGE